MRCDLVLGCSDSQHARVLLSDLAKHYLVPSSDVGVRMEGDDGRVSAQLVELTQHSPDMPCALCDGRIDFASVARELMSVQEREERMVAADQALRRGENADQYWAGELPQLHTVGYLTTLVGSLARGMQRASSQVRSPCRIRACNSMLASRASDSSRFRGASVTIVADERMLVGQTKLRSSETLHYPITGASRQAPPEG